MPTLTRDELTRLTPEERLNLIGELWNSLDPKDIPVSSAQRLELERRLGSFDQDRSGGISWEELKTELARRAH